MKEVITKTNGQTVVVREFDSLGEFYTYITNTPTNNAFTGKLHSSVDGSYGFTKTKSFEEAVDLFRNGWTAEAKKLTGMFETAKRAAQPTVKGRPQYSVQGFQCSVPRYLQGLPDSMINKKNVVQKQKVVTITKSIDYAAYVSKEQIETESIKALMIINKIESQGVRCNINVALGAIKGDHKEIVKVKIKSANERLNISKQAFPLVHPSMLRRLMFRYIEVAPTITPAYVGGYGKPAADSDLKSFMSKDEYFIPPFVAQDISTIRSIDDLK